MIRFTLRCSNGHNFDSWFKSNEAYESLGSAGMLSCPVCGVAEIEKSLMAPGLGSSSNGDEAQPDEGKPSLSVSSTPAERALKELRKWVERNSEYVGPSFAKEARDMHEGVSQKRSVFGEAKFDEAVDLLDDGIPVLPLPWPSTRKTN